MNQRTGGNPNPEADGPPKRTWKMFNRTISHMYGADDTAMLDNGQYHASVIVPGRNRKFPLATQGQEWSIRYGGTPGLASYRPYGTRGGFSAGAPQPTVRADPGGRTSSGPCCRWGRRVTGRRRCTAGCRGACTPRP